MESPKKEELLFHNSDQIQTVKSPPFLSYNEENRKELVDNDFNFVQIKIHNATDLSRYRYINDHRVCCTPHGSCMCHLYHFKNAE